MAISLTTVSLPFSSRPSPNAPAEKDDDEQRHRQPGPFAAVEAAQDEVVDRSDEHDVGDQQDQ